MPRRPRNREKVRDRNPRPRGKRLDRLPRDLRNVWTGYTPPEAKTADRLQEQYEHAMDRWPAEPE